MPLSELSQEQQDAFHERLRELRMDPSLVVKKITPETHRGSVVLSADARISSVPPTMVTVLSLDEVKRIAGNPDEDFEKGLMSDHHEALAPWPADKNDKDPAQLSAEENNRINAAEMGYIYGNSKNFSSYKTIIEKQKYPARFAVFAVEDVCIDSTNSPYLIKSESAHNYGTMTICQGGSLVFEANAVMTVQKMVKSTATKCP
jgi:hypothetical protein